jgi:hypothetical protein
LVDSAQPIKPQDRHSRFAFSHRSHWTLFLASQAEDVGNSTDRRLLNRDAERQAQRSAISSHGHGLWSHAAVPFWAENKLKHWCEGAGGSGHGAAWAAYWTCVKLCTPESPEVEEKRRKRGIKSQSGSLKPDNRRSRTERCLESGDEAVDRKESSRSK